MIKLQISEGKIFGKDRALIQIIQALINGVDPVQIDLNGEGPCCESNGIYALLDEICCTFNFPKKQIEIHTANFLESHSEYCIIKQHQNYELAAAMQALRQGVDTKKIFDNNFLHFGHFIGHGNKSRLHLASYLWSNHSTQTLQSYHCDVHDPYHREFVGLEDLMFDASISQEQIKWAFDLLSHAPLKLESTVCYPIGPDQTFNITGYYSKFFLELVSLTFTSGCTFYIDEKIWRPVLMRTPFMVQGPAGLILNLQKMGFRTFDRWWDEGYSEDPADCQVAAMIDNIKRLSQLSVLELKSMYADMSVVLDHNLHRLLELKKTDFTKVFRQ
jgi:hypothetical protein